jgi:hypothetical protein
VMIAAGLSASTPVAAVRRGGLHGRAMDHG